MSVEQQIERRIDPPFLAEKIGVLAFERGWHVDLQIVADHHHHTRNAAQPVKGCESLSVNGFRWLHERVLKRPTKTRHFCKMTGFVTGKGGRFVGNRPSMDFRILNDDGRARYEARRSRQECQRRHDNPSAPRSNTVRGGTRGGSVGIALNL
ncbi:hypothetical protein H9K75_19385 [Diaphorobacter aerolatus]|uniref:Uncharacterized protein n=1 Tax=Diaphorobacter aerolatus TaxID=1288495 RepID=A0A7H0GQW8_9BURK|nr:hypothetical protein H9K75_19385 [Diaphorobacter aerolatus]